MPFRLKMSLWHKERVWSNVKNALFEEKRVENLKLEYIMDKHC